MVLNAVEGAKVNLHVRYFQVLSKKITISSVRIFLMTPSPTGSGSVEAIANK